MIQLGKEKQEKKIWSPSTCAANHRLLSLAQLGSTFTHTDTAYHHTKPDHGRVESQEKQATPPEENAMGRTPKDQNRRTPA